MKVSVNVHKSDKRFDSPYKETTIPLITCSSAVETPEFQVSRKTYFHKNGSNNNRLFKFVLTTSSVAFITLTILLIWYDYKVISAIQKTLAINQKAKLHLDEFSKSLLKLNESFNELEKAVKANEAINSVKSHQLQELLDKFKSARIQNDLKPDNLKTGEAITSRGTIVWKIANFSKVLNTSKHGGITKLFSKPFYTGSNGYKMRLYIYPNGKNKGLNSYLSIFFMLQKGEFDEILDWPFKCNVTITILDQSEKHNNEVLSFTPKPNEPSFQKPSNDMNEESGWGWYNFISHNELKLNGFLKNDALYIKANVSSSAD